MRSVDWFFVTCLLLMATAFRVIGLGFGQPIAADFPSDQPYFTLNENTPVHPDEYSYVQIPLRMLLAEERNPYFYHNPSFLIDLNYFTFWLTGEKDALTWASRDGLGSRREAPFRSYFIGRTYAMLFGVLGVATVYATVRLALGTQTALLAGLLMAFSLPLVQHSHYAKTSIIAATFTALTVWASFNSIRSRGASMRMFILAGVFAGMSAGNRYDAAGISIVVFLSGCWLLVRQFTWQRMAWVLLGWVAFPLSFVLIMPWSVTDTANFADNLKYIMGLYTSDALPFYADKWVSLFYLYRYLLVYGLGIATIGLLWIGIFAPYVVRAFSGLRVAITIVLVYLLVYSYVVLRPTMTFNSDQLVSTSIPQFILLVSLGYATWLQLVRPNRALRVGVLMILVAQPLTLSTQLTRQFSLPDTRTLMQQWVYAHVPRLSHIHLNGSYNVPLDEEYYTWTHTYDADFPSVETLRETYQADYVIVSDAIYTLYERTPFIYSKDFRQQAQAYLHELDRSLTLVAEVQRPPIWGTNEPVHTFTYWHNPGLKLYCMTEEACRTIR